MTTMLIMPMNRSSAQPTTPTTISRQDQAAAIRNECGTSASSRLAVDWWSTVDPAAAARNRRRLSVRRRSRVRPGAVRTDSRPVSYARCRLSRTRCKRLNRHLLAVPSRRVRITVVPAAHRTASPDRHPCPIRTSAARPRA